VIRCSWILSRGGEVQRFTDTDRDHLVSNVIECMASDGLRTICLAYKNFVISMQANYFAYYIWQPFRNCCLIQFWFGACDLSTVMRYDDWWLRHHRRLFVRGDWKRRSGKRGSVKNAGGGKHGTIMQGWKMREKPVWKATLWRLWRHKTSVARTQVFFNVIYLMFLID